MPEKEVSLCIQEQRAALLGLLLVITCIGAALVIFVILYVVAQKAAKSAADERDRANVQLDVCQARSERTRRLLHICLARPEDRGTARSADSPPVDPGAALGRLVEVRQSFQFPAALLHREQVASRYIGAGEDSESSAPVPLLDGEPHEVVMTEAEHGGYYISFSPDADYLVAGERGDDGISEVLVRDTLLETDRERAVWEVSRQGPQTSVRNVGTGGYLTAAGDDDLAVAPDRDNAWVLVSHTLGVAVTRPNG